MRKMIRITISILLLACFSVASFSTYAASIQINEIEAESSYSKELLDFDNTAKLIKSAVHIVKAKPADRITKRRFLPNIKQYKSTINLYISSFVISYGTRGPPIA